MKSTLLLAALLTLSVPSFAEEAKPSAASKLGAGIRQWFLHVKEGLTESSVSGQRQKARITAVAAVRGADQGDLDPEAPVWKSGTAMKKSKAMKAERAELSAAVDAALSGDLAAANAKLDAFEAAHADSSLLSEAREIRGKLKEAGTASPEAAAAGAPAEAR